MLFYVSACRINSLFASFSLISSANNDDIIPFRSSLFHSYVEPHNRRQKQRTKKPIHVSRKGGQYQKGEDGTPLLLRLPSYNRFA